MDALGISAVTASKSSSKRSKLVSAALSAVMHSFAFSLRRLV